MKTTLGFIVLLVSISVSSGASAELVGPVEAEQARLRRHFASVQQLMSTSAPAGLTADAQQKRRAMIEALGSYAERGVFPRNTRHKNTRQPYFIDDEQRACAVGHLMLTSGYEQAALDIAASQNNAYLPDIRHAALAPWLAQHGITAAEAALIQPGYCHCEDVEEPVCGVDGQSYPNHCAAAVCGGVEVASCGKCNDDDDYPVLGPLQPTPSLEEYCAENDCACDGGGCSVASTDTRRDDDELPWLLGLSLLGLACYRRLRD